MPDEVTAAVIPSPVEVGSVWFETWTVNGQVRWNVFVVTKVNLDQERVELLVVANWIGSSIGEVWTFWTWGFTMFQPGIYYGLYRVA